MAIKERTKKMFAEKLIEMSKNKRIQDIQVKDLCKECGTNRATFYYHFKDKYDLVSWIYAQIYQEEIPKSVIVINEEMILGIFNRLWENRAFFVNALQDHSQNCLREYLINFYFGEERKVVCRYLGTETLDKETEYLIKHYIFGCLLHTIEWLQGKNQLSAEQMGSFQVKIMPEILRKAWMG